MFRIGPQGSPTPKGKILKKPLSHQEASAIPTASVAGKLLYFLPGKDFDFWSLTSAFHRSLGICRWYVQTTLPHNRY